MQYTQLNYKVNILTQISISAFCCKYIHLKSGAPNSAKFRGGGVAEGHPRFDKGGVAIIFTFYALKI